MKFSFCIITYKRQKDCIEAIESIKSLENIQNYTYEILVLNNDTKSKYLSEYYLSDNLVNVFNSTENLGVALGRNRVVNLSTGEFLVFLDDDAVFANDCSGVLKFIDSEFSRNDALAAIAFSSFSYFNPKVKMPKETPKFHPKTKFCSHYVGVGHAIKRTCFVNLQGYSKKIFYGSEEHDMAYKIFKDQKRIKYSENIKVLHKKTLNGRLPDDEVKLSIARNRLIVAKTHLPKIFYYSHIVFWCFYCFRFRLDWREMLRYIFSLQLEHEDKATVIQALSYYIQFRRNILY